jgi:hypothetical protein
VEVLTATLVKAALGALGVVIPRRLSILIYHRVHARPDSIFPHEPDASSFDQRMRLVARSFNVLSLGEAVNHLAAGSLPPRALVITFDDGYADNAEVALPILRRHGLTATFFVATGFLDGGRMWNDSVIECVRATTKPALDLEAFGLGRLSLTDAGDRRAAIEQLLPRIKYLTLAQREEAIVRLQAITGVAALPIDLMMRTDQVRKLHLAGKRPAPPPVKRLRCGASSWFSRGGRDGQGRGTGGALATACGGVAGERRHSEGVL